MQPLLSGALGVDSKQIKNKVISNLHPMMENRIGDRIL